MPASSKTSIVQNCVDWIRKHFILLLLVSYAFAWFMPGPGEIIRHTQVSQFLNTPICSTHLLLAVLLLNAGLGVTWMPVYSSWSRAKSALLGLTTRFIFASVSIGGLVAAANYLEPGETVSQCILGFGILAAMPAAASSPAWTQNAGGSVGTTFLVVVGSTLVSPFLVGFTSTWISELQPLTRLGSQVVSADHFFAFALLWIVVPTAIGFLCRCAFKNLSGPQSVAFIRIANSICLLVLIYAFAAVAFKQVNMNGNIHIVWWVAGITAMFCLSAFACGYAVGRVVRLCPEEKTSLYFSVGMFNNGIALLIGTVLADDNPIVFLPMIFYAMFQHLMAAMTTMLIAAKRND